MLLAGQLVFAGFFDGSDSSFDVGDMVPITIIGGIILGLLAWLLDLRIRAIVARTVDPLREELHERTAPIQPKANGGKSLPDVAAKAKRTEKIVLLMAESMGIKVPDESEDDDH